MKSWVKVHWLQSSFRQSFLTYRFYSLPLLFGNKAIADVYLSLNDPHSFMLVQVLSDIEKRFNLTFNLYLVADTTLSSEVDVALLKEWSLKDANYIADKYGLIKVKSFPNMKSLVTGQQTWLLQVKTVAQALDVFTHTWLDKFTDHFPLSTPVITAQINNQRRLFRRGYHASGAIFFCGNWFVGIDRLEHLELLLHDKGLNKEDDGVNYYKNNLRFTASNLKEESSPTIEAFVSLNSPFAYIGLVQAKKLSDHYQVHLSIKPMIPRSMRGRVIDEHKQRYMLLDATREANKLDIPLREYAKPLNQGVINIYALFSFAEKINKSYEFMMAAFDAIYVTPINLELDKNIKTICQKLDMNYEDAIAYAEENDWQKWSEDNYLMLNNLGLWGVPCFKYEDVSCWGQDRLVQIEDAILAT